MYSNTETEKFKHSNISKRSDFDHCTVWYRQDKSIINSGLLKVNVIYHCASLLLPYFWDFVVKKNAPILMVIVFLNINTINKCN